MSITSLLNSVEEVCGKYDLEELVNAWLYADTDSALIAGRGCSISSGLNLTGAIHDLTQLIGLNLEEDRDSRDIYDNRAAGPRII